MIKKILSIILALALVLTIMPASVFAASDEEAIKALTEANEILQKAINDLGIKDADLFSSIFDDITDVARVVGTYATAINGSVNFLKLIGVIKDENSEKLADILAQLTVINETVQSMDKKLNDITVAMAKLQASVDFHAREQKATSLRQNWNTFIREYEENGMDALITQYQAGLLNLIKAWFTSDSSRVQGGVDNSQIILLYNQKQNDNDTYKLTYSSENNVPRDFNGKHFSLTSDYLPTAGMLSADFDLQNFSWSVDTYRSSFIDYTAEKIKSNTDALAFAEEIYPAVSETEAAEKLASDAIDTLMYRLAYIFVNQDSSFTLNVQNKFANYCSNLLKFESGMDALIETYFLTHAFQFEVENDIRTFCDEMALKAATYGAFAMNVLGISDFAGNTAKANVLDNYSNVIKSIDEIEKGSIIENHPHYCYLTNTDLDFETLVFTSEATIYTKEDRASQTYRDYSAKPINYGFFGDPKSTRDNLIGNDSAMLLLYTLQSNGHNDIYNYLHDTILLPGYGSGNYGNIVTQCNAETDMPFTESNTLKTYNIIGDRFKGNNTMTLSNIPSGDQEYVVYRRMISGSTLNMATGKLSTDQVLSGLAIYGESHMLWSYDTGAFFGGDFGQAQYDGFEQRDNKVVQSYQYYFDHNFTQTLNYNALVCKPVEAQLNSGRYNILERFKDILLPEVEEEGFMLSAPVAFAAGGAVGLAGGAEPVKEQRKYFTDVDKNAWFAEAANWAYEKGIAKGNEFGEFEAKKLCSKAEAITFLWRAAGSPVSNRKVMFEDIQQGKFYMDALAWAIDTDIANDKENNIFAPSREITKQEFADYIYKLAGSLGLDTEAQNPIAWCIKNNILQGKENGLSLEDIITRAETITMIKRLFDHMISE